MYTINTNKTNTNKKENTMTNNTKKTYIPLINVKIYENEETKTLAFVDLLFGEFLVTGITIKAKDDGFWICMPSKKGKDGQYHDTMFPTTAEYRTALYDAIAKKYIETKQNGD